MPPGSVASASSSCGRERRGVADVATSRTRSPCSVHAAAVARRARAQPIGSPSAPTARDGRRNVGAPSAIDARAAAGRRRRRTRPRSTCGPTRTAPPRASGVGSRGQRGGDRLGRLVARGRRRRQRRRAPATTSSSVAPPSPADRLDLEPVRGQRAGLVEAQDVDVAERLDRVRLLDQRPEPQDPHRAQGVGDGDRDEQAVGDEAGEERRVGDDVAQRRPPARGRGRRAGSRGRGRSRARPG